EQLIPLFADTDAVFVVRNVQPTRLIDALLALAQSTQVPLYYVLDDNFVLSSEEAIQPRYFLWYTAENLRNQLTGFAGMIVTSDSLWESFT
ncbi:hypothetical protein AAEJ42_22430, partial [Shewanella algae]|uniref:hypothetical protein n=1 Tax=Shewanella algae TaxID=38313 RepID=UPI00313CF527